MKTLEHFKSFCDQITTSGSRKYKQDVLSLYKDDEVIKKYLLINFNPYTVYGLSTKKLSKNIVSTSVSIPTVFNLFDYLTVHNTGRDEDISVCQKVLNTIDPSLRDLLEELICKDLSIGCDAKTINSVIPNLIPTFDVQLANKYFDKPEYVEGKEFAITTKIDGGRIIAIKENGQVSFFTRAGQRYEGLVDLERELLDCPYDNFVLDGEITLFDYKNYNSKDAYKQAMKITRKDGEKHDIKMLVFDFMSSSSFQNQECPVPYITRQFELSSMFNMCNFRFFEKLPILYKGTDTTKITEILDSEISRGQEGIMINICDSPYEFKRTNSLLKCKKMKTLDLQIVGFEEGTGRLVGTLGSILVRYKNNNVVKVGSGFSDSIRTEIWDNRSKYLDTICEIKYFEETSNQNGGESLRFPIFVDFRYDKLTPDY